VELLWLVTCVAVWLVVAELLVVVWLVVWLDEELVVATVVVGVDEVVVATAVVTVVGPLTGGFGGSRWNIPESDVPAVSPAPTAKPSVGDVSDTECNPRPA
jgi:hypothetical protein